MQPFCLDSSRANVDAAANFFPTNPQGETSAPQDVTSNVERSRHIGDDQEQKRIYDGEVCRRALLPCLLRCTLPESCAPDEHA